MLRVGLSRTQHRRREVVVVGCVGEILCFEGDAGAEVVAIAAFADLLAVHALSCIELESRLVGVDLRAVARRGFISLGSPRGGGRGGVVGLGGVCSLAVVIFFVLLFLFY